MLRNCVLLWIAFLEMAAVCHSQLSETRPLNSPESEIRELAYVNINIPDLNKIASEDRLADKRKDIPFRFGIPIEVGIDLSERSQRDITEGGTIERLGISAPNARTLNLNFSQFDLPEGGWMHIYNPDKTQILGAFTEKNEKADGQFATYFIYDDSLVIEVFLPGSDASGRIELGEVVYGYRGFDKNAENFGESGSCNINVTCPEGIPWKDQRRSVVMMTTMSNSRYCTGVLINNVREDGRPFVLSANHCQLSSNDIFVFNYESGTCAVSQDCTLTQSVNGAKVLARDAYSDFLLVELNSKPPSSFNAFFTGWNNTGEKPLRGTCIHHPKGDLKKISLDLKSVLSSGYYTKGNNHWKVDYWDHGTTENASSGAPLFDQYGKVIGQLHGGEASCTIIEEDYFGKFSTSWDWHPDSIRQLKYWLDPDNSGARILSGKNGNDSPLDYDVAGLGFKNLSPNLCSSSKYIPEVIVKNRGTQSIDSLDIKLYVNNVVQSNITTWIGNLGPGKTTVISCPGLTLTTGYYFIKSEVILLGHTDLNSSNNITTTGVSWISSPLRVELVLKTDDFGDETSWEIMSSTGYEFASRGNFPSVNGGAVYRDTICLFDGCFRLNFYDAVGDGICCNFGKGYFALLDALTGDTIIKNMNFGTADTSHYFCLGDSCTLMILARIRGSSGTTNGDGEIVLEVLSGNSPFVFQWTNGKTGPKITGLLPGIYGVRISDSLNCTDSGYFAVPVGTKIADIPEKEGWNLYPNPTSGKVYITGIPSGNELNYWLFDSRGRMHREGKRKLIGESAEFDFSEFENGLYFLIVVQGEFRRSEKILIHPSGY